MPTAPSPSLQEFVKKKMQERLRVYGLDPTLILQDFMLEQQISADYDGRQLLELLQNADDAAGRDPYQRPGQAWIRLTKNTLDVANTGATFNEAGVQSLLYSNLSPKSLQPDQIGAKGLGFRAVLSWAEKLEIYSGPLQVAFSAAHAHSVLEKLRTGEHHVEVEQMLRQARQQTTRADYPIAVLRCADVLDEKAPSFAGASDYDTLIRVQMKPDQLPALRQQLQEELTPEVMVFLPRLTQLSIECDGVHWQLLREEKAQPNGIKEVRITRVNPDGSTTAYTWQVLLRTGAIPAEYLPAAADDQVEAVDDFYEVKVAWQATPTPGPGRLFSYFRTGVEFPLPSLVHATFNLSANRQSLLLTDTNRFLLDVAAQLLVEAVEAIAQGKPADPYLPLRLLWDGAAEGWDLHPELSDLGFDEALMRALRQATIFPVISGHYRPVSAVVLMRRPFARYLVPQPLDELLCWPTAAAADPADDLEKLAQVIDCLRDATSTLPIPLLLQRVAEARPTGNTADFSRYAALLRLTEEELRARPSFKQALLTLDWPALFTDQSGNALDGRQVIFLPPDGSAKTKLPGLNVVNASLAAALLQAFNLATYQLLSSPLSIFNVRPYEFPELAHYLIQQHGTRVKALHPALFRLYQAERGRGRNRLHLPPLDQAILLPTRTREVANASTLYFGHNIDNTKSLCAELYAHAPSRLVGSRAAMGLTNKQDNDTDIRDYLHWCGVRDSPRWVQESRPGKQYIDHVLRRFEYRRFRLGGHLYAGFLDFRKQNPAGWDRCQVASLDDLDGILANAPADAVLRWVWASPTEGLSEALKKDKEPKISRLSDSFLHAGRYNYNPTLVFSQMPSYVRWKFATAAWLPGVEESRIAPQRILLAPRGQQDGEFSPVLYGAAPSLQLLEKKKITDGRREARELLTSVGVNLAVSELPTELLYQTLLELPQRNPKGDRAHSLYRELAINYDTNTLNAQDPAREDFLKRGQVWCKTPSGPRYVAIAGKSARYVSDATYSPRLLERFILLDVPPKLSHTKMQLLFGVPLLDRLATSVQGTPVLHPLQESFALDWQQLRHYVYALLPQNTLVADKGDALKSLQVKLTSQLRVSHALAPEESLTESYAPYSYLLLPNRRTAWMVVPERIDLATLKTQPRFQDALAEILSTVLEAETLREAFMRFIAAPTVQRDELLALRQGTTTEQVQASLQQVQQALALPDESRQVFWLHVATAARSGTKTALRPPLNEAAWPAWLSKTFGAKRKAVVLQAFEQLNPGAPWQFSDLRILFELFGTLGLSAAAYNRHAPQPIDFSVLFQAEYDVLIARHAQTFEQLLFKQLETASVRKQQRFEAERLAYQQLRVPSSIPADFKPEIAFRQQVKTKWSVDVAEVPPGIDLPEIAAGHEAAFIQRATIRGFTPEFLRAFLDKMPERRSLLFFGSIPALLARLPSPVVTEGPGNPIRDVFTVGNEDVAFDNPNDLLTQLLVRWAGHDTTIHPLRTQALPNQDDSDTGQTRTGSRAYGSGHTPRPEVQALVGAIGEGLAFEALRQREGVSNVEIKSENAAKLGRMAGRMGLGYDLTYVDADGLHFVEVKSSVVPGNRQFFISQAEVKFGEQHPQNYEILLVTGIHEASGPRYESIGNPFVYPEGQGFLHNSGFTVEHDTFRVRFEVLSNS